MPLPGISTVAILGIGQMGAAAAVAFSRAGYRVLLWARNAEKLHAVRDTLDRLNGWMDENVVVPQSPVVVPRSPDRGTRPPGAIELVTDLDVPDATADLVLDCIAEDMDQKVALLSRLRRSIDRQAAFISTTSGLSITQMQRRSGVGPLLAGAHFWNPPHLMPLVEVIRGEDTPDKLMTLVCRVVEDIGKIPVRVERDVPGFIGNRLLHAMWREAIHLIEQGVASPADIDRVARLSFGLRQPAVGPFENMDLVGLDLIHTIQSYLFPDLATAKEPQRPIAERRARGELGMPTGRGFYDWRTRDPNELLERRDRQIVRQLDFLREMDAL